MILPCETTLRAQEGDEGEATLILCSPSGPQFCPAQIWQHHKGSQSSQVQAPLRGDLKFSTCLRLDLVSEAEVLIYSSLQTLPPVWKARFWLGLDSGPGGSIPAPTEGSQHAPRNGWPKGLLSPWGALRGSVVRGDSPPCSCGLSWWDACRRRS